MIVPFYRPDITEREVDAVSKVLRSGWLTTGKVTKKFEESIANYIGVAKVAALNSQTSAAHCCLMLLGIGPGDEVIVPAYTYTATCSVVSHVGATPIMVDCAKNSFEMDYDLLSEAITKRTKAIIAVDLGGVVCDYRRIFEIADKKRHLFKAQNPLQERFSRVAIIADAAHSIGASRNGVMAGAIADFTNFSFHAVKNLTTGEGGAASWLPIDGLCDEEIYRRYMLLSLHGQTKDALSKLNSAAWEYDIEDPLYKYNMTDIAAALGQIQLNRFSSMQERRKKIVEFYYDRFKNYNVTWLEHFGSGFVSSLHLFLMRLTGLKEAQRNQIIKTVGEDGVSLNVHYKPLPMLTAYKKRGFNIEDFPNAYAQYENLITLPLFSSMTDSEAEYVVETVSKYI